MLATTTKTLSRGISITPEGTEGPETLPCEDGLADSDDLAPARGLVLGAGLGAMCLAALAGVVWWAIG
jgi:hypothetical protein